MFKTANIGSIDRLVRIIVGLALIVAPYFTQMALWDNTVARYGLPIIGAVLVLTALFRFCPLYRLIGASTCKI
ncbi:MAG: DUF2892 domain-containing protein [Ahrensia sp.]|nr:DUF2892 domain-containing protein [Ahrensia sp.]